MLNQDKLNKVKRILSAQTGAQVPTSKWKGQSFTFNTINGQRITIPIEDFFGVGHDYGPEGGTITYHNQKYEVDAATSTNFSSWLKENRHYKPENSTTQPNEFAQGKMAGYPKAEDIQTPVQQEQEQEKTQPLSTEEITASNKPLTSPVSNISGIKDVAKITLPKVPDITLTPKMEAKQEVLETKEDAEAKVIQDQMLSDNAKNSSPGVEPSFIGSPENISITPSSINSGSNTGEPNFLQAPTPSGKGNTYEEGKKSFMDKLKSPGMQKAGRYGAMVGQAADIATNMFVDKSEFADNDPTQGKGRAVYDAVANSMMAFSPIGTIAGGAMKAVGFINDIVGGKSDEIAKDEDTFKQLGGSYGGAEAKMAEAQSKAGKKYGLFSGSARRRANKDITEAKRQQSIMQGIAKEASDRASSQTMLSQANTLSLERQLSGGYDQRYMRAAKSGTKIQYFKDPFKVKLTEAKEFFVTLTDTPPVFKQGGTILDQLDTKHTFEVILSEPVEELKKGGKIRKNEEGEIVPDKCDSCGGDIVVQIHGEPVYLCKECNKFFGVVPFKHKNGGTLERDIEVIETNTTQKSVIPEGALHKNKHHLDEVGVDDSELTKKGIPVVDNDGDQQAEIELNEIIFTLEVTKELESRYKEFYQEGTSESRKDELAIEAGRLLWKEIIYNTDDRTGLIDTLKQGGALIAKQGSKIDEAFQEFLKTLPDNQRNYSEDTYRMKRYWELNGKPKDFKEALEKEMFILEDDGFYHARSVAYNPELDEYEFMKMPGHKTTWMEVEGWYNGMNFEPKEDFTEEQTGGDIENYILTPKKGREAEESRRFRQQYILDKSGPFWKYIPRNRSASKKALGGTISQEDINIMVKQALINLLNK